MDRKESQRLQIQSWLKSGRSITPMQALELCGCFRLSSVIYRLKYDYGMPIKTDMVYLPDGRRYAEYYIGKKKETIDGNTDKQ